MFKLTIPDGEIITAESLPRYIKAFNDEQQRRENLFNYYLGKHDILKRKFSDANKPNNRVVSPWAHNITDFATGYFIGEPVRYNDVDDIINEIRSYNDDAAVNTELAKNCSICGVAYELQFIDKYGELRYISINPVECFVIYDTSLESEIKYFIRVYEQTNIAADKTTKYVDVYDAASITKYHEVNGNYSIISTKPHGFDEVPVVEYKNSPEAVGDFELCLSLIDAYDTLVSNSINDSSEFSDAYLLLKGVIAEGEDIDEMKEKRVLCIDVDADAKWLTKDINSTFSEDMKNRISSAIHKFSNVPDMTDQNFAANASGVAMKYKLLGLEDITAKKENEFRRGLIRRFEIMSAYLAKIGDAFDWRNVKLIFTRNLPSNLEEAVEITERLAGTLSKKTRIEMLPLDLDADAEVAQTSKEEADSYDVGFNTKF